MSQARVRVALTPPVPGTLPAEMCAVAVDVLRATSTLAVARQNGCGRVLPFGTTGEAIAYRDAHRADTLACGERDGVMVAGFDLGNSPFEYTRERVAGKTLAFASTNGSRAMLAASRCHRLWLASFVNLSATLEALAEESEIWLVCAGKLGAEASEDTACAATIAARLAELGARLVGKETQSIVAKACRDATAVHRKVTGASHGRWLASLGPAFAADVEFCAGLDTVGVAHPA